MLRDLERLPGPQRDALRVAFGLQAGDTPDQFLVALAALSLLAEVAEASPLVCLIDDAQWLDEASTRTLTFVARRLLAERIAILVDGRVRDRIVAETRGNPLALMELHRGLTSAALAGGFGLPDAMPLASRVEAGFVRRLEPLPVETRRLLQAALRRPPRSSSAPPR